MIYSLYFDTVKIGTIIQTNSNFPSNYGEVIYNDNLEENDAITNYINYSIEADKLFSKDESEWLEFIENEEQNYLDLINSEQWTLKNNNELINILTPIFHKNNRISWRYNF